MLILLAIVVLAVIFRFRKELILEHVSMQYAFGFLCGGIIGNLTDRLVHGHVIDFLDFHLLPDYRWPAFNVADMAICTGMFLYIVCNIRMTRKTSAQPS